jgi:hypothetical protein
VEQDETAGNHNNENGEGNEIEQKSQPKLTKQELEEEEQEQYIFRAIKFMSAPNRAMNLQKIVEILETGIQVDLYILRIFVFLKFFFFDLIIVYNVFLFSFLFSNRRDESGRTPLMLACMYGHEQCKIFYLFSYWFIIIITFYLLYLIYFLVLLSKRFLVTFSRSQCYAEIFSYSFIFFCKLYHI